MAQEAPRDHMRKGVLAAVIVFTSTVFMAAGAFAATFPVTSLSNSGPGSLRQAMLDANATAGPDVIDATGLVGYLQLASPLPQIAEDVEILGAGPDRLLIGRQAFVPAGTPQGILFSVAAPATAKISGLKVSHPTFIHWLFLLVPDGAKGEIENCVLERTAGIQLGGILTMRDCTCRYNHGSAAGVIAANLSTQSVISCEDCVFEHNSIEPTLAGGSTQGGAGVLWLWCGSATLRRCRFASNAGFGASGAIYKSAASVSLSVFDCAFVRNFSTGGAAFFGCAAALEVRGGTVVCQRTLFEANVGQHYGAVYFYDSSGHGPSTFRDCTFVRNEALAPDGRGGAIFVEQCAQINLINCTLSGNKAGGASGRGGAVYITDDFSNSSYVRMDNCTVTGNTALGGGGGLLTIVQPAINQPGIILRNTVVSQNNVGAVNVEPDIAGSHAVAIQSLGNNFIGNVGAFPYVAAAGDLVGTPAAPLDALLGPLQDNAGPAATHLPLPGSPLLDAGRLPINGLVLDQRGLARVVDIAGVPNAGNGNGCDIGATESQTSGSISASQPVLEFALPVPGVASTPMAIVVGAVDVASAVFLQVAPPFELASSPAGPFGLTAMTGLPGAGGTVAAVAFHVRYNPILPGTHRVSLTLTAANAETVRVTLAGDSTGIAVPQILVAGMVLEVPVPAESTGGGASYIKSYEVSGVGLTGPVTISVAPPFGISEELLGPKVAQIVSIAPVNGWLRPMRIYFRYVANYGYSQGGTIYHTSPGANTVTVAINANMTGTFPPQGPIAVAVTAMSFTTPALNQPSTEQVRTVSGAGVSGPITISATPPFEVSLTAGTGFGASVSTVAPAGGIVPPTPVFVRYRPQEGIVHGGGLRFESPGVFTPTVWVSGVVLEPPVVPTILAPASLPAFTTPATGTASAAQSFLVTASGLLAPVIVSVAPPFEVSLAPGSGFGSVVVTAAPVGGVVPPTPIFVRYWPGAGQAHAAAVLLRSQGWTSTETSVALTGSVVVPPPQPTVMVGATNLVFVTTAVGVPSQLQSYTVSGTALSAPIDVLAPPHFEVSLAPGGGFGPGVSTGPPSAGAIAATVVYVRYNPLSGQGHSAVISHASLGAASLGVSVSGTVVAIPQINVGSAGLSFLSPAVGTPSAEQQYFVSGAGLAGPVTVTALPPFEVSLASGGPFAAGVVTPPPVAGSLAGLAIYVRFVPVSPLPVQRGIDHASPGTVTVSIPVSGSVVATPPPSASITVLSGPLAFVTTALQVASPEQQYEVLASNAAGPVTVTAPSAFQVSLTPGAGFGSFVRTQVPVGGAIPPTLIYVRYLPTSGAGHGGFVSHSCVGVPSVALGVSGSVSAQAPLAGADAGNCAVGLASNGLRPVLILLIGTGIMGFRRRRLGQAPTAA